MIGWFRRRARPQSHTLTQMCFHNVTHRDGLDSVSARLKSHTNPPDLEPTNHNQIATAERLGKPGEGGRRGEEEEEEQEEEETIGGRIRKRRPLR